MEFPGQGMPLGWSVKSEASSQIGNLCACPLPSAPVRWAWLRPPHPVYTGRHQLPSSCAQRSLVGLRSWLGNPWGTLSYLASLEGEEQPSVVHLVCPESPQPGRGLVCAEVLHHSCDLELI